MRKELEFPTINEENMELVKELIDTVADGLPPERQAALEELSALTGKEHDKSEFMEYWGWTELDTLAQQVLCPEPPVVKDLTKQELVEIIPLIQQSFMNGEEAVANYYAKLLRKSLPLTDVLNYVMRDDKPEVIAENMLQAASSGVICL